MNVHSSRPAVRVIDRVTDAWVNSAARRWPDDLSHTMRREWHAELAALRADRAVGAVVRTWRAITFAASLALSRSVESESPMSAPSPRFLSTLGRAMVAAVSVFGVALLALALFGLASASNEGNINQYFSASTVAGVIVFWIVLAVGIMGWIGTVAGRRGFTWVHWSPAKSAIACTAPLGIAMWLVLGMSPYGFRSSQWVDPGFAALAWIMVSAGTVTLALRLIAAGRRAAAWISGIAGSLVAVDLAAIAGGLRTASQVDADYGHVLAWFPLSMVSNTLVNFGSYVVPPTPAGPPPDYPYPSIALLGTVGPLAGSLLLCSAFVIGYAMRAARADVPVVPAAAVEPAAADTASEPVTRVIGWAGATGVAIGWAVLVYLSVANPRFLAADGTIFNATGPVWYRVITMLLIAAATAMTWAGRGPVALPAIGTFVVLFASDGVINRMTSRGSVAGPVMLIVCAATLAGARWLTGRLAVRHTATMSGARDADTSTRRALVGVAVLGALAIPTAVNISELTPSGLVVAEYADGAVLWLLAITAALASRRTPLRRLATIAYVVVPLAVVVGFTAMTTGSGLLYYPRATFFIQAPLAVVVLAAARWRATAADDERPPRWRSPLAWALYGIGAAVASVPVSDMLQYSGRSFTDLVTRLDPGPADQFSGIGELNPSLAGQLVLAIALAVVAARWTFPAGNDGALPEPSLVPVGSTGN